MSTVFGQYKWRRHLRCTNVWILCLATSLIPHQWMIMVHQSDKSVTIFKLQLALGKLVMLSQGKHFYIPSNLLTFSKLFLITAVPQQFGPILKMNTVELSTSSIFESTMSTQVSVKTPTQRWMHTLLALINFFKRLSTTSLSPSPACSRSQSICSSCYPSAKDGKHFH